MKSLGKPGKISSACEIANISPFGLWLLVGGKEYYLDHKRYPWFKEASVEDVLHVEECRAGHIRWPQLDIDLHIDALENPERYPLIAKSTKNKRIERTRKTRRSS